LESYLRDYNSNKKVRNDPRGGSQSKLTAEGSEKLEKHLVERTDLKVKNIVAYTPAG